MVDLSHASPAAIQTIGVLNLFDKRKGQPEGWTQSVIDKINQDIRANTPSNPNSPDNVEKVLSGFSPEEREAWAWYQREVVPPDKWERLVKNYEENDGHLKMGVDPPPPFDPDKEYVSKSGTKFQAPHGVKTWSGANNTGGNLTVSHEAINFFIKNVGAIAGDGTGILLHARTTLDVINPRPGGFARAELMRQRVRGSSPDDPGLQGDTMALLAAVHSALFDLQADLRTLLKTYDEAEDFNTLTSAGLKDVMDGSSSKIEDLGDYGQSRSTGGGSGTDGGTGDKKSDDEKSDD
jgi:hypothetical protein